MTTPERPMLFSKPMVLALLAGRKTQTRRVAKARRMASLLATEEDGSNVWADSFIFDEGNASWLASEAPARAGEEMYVREAFRFLAKRDALRPSDVPSTDTVFHEADLSDGVPAFAGKLRPGIHMPRWCSRIERTIVGCRLERLNDCSAADAIAEGLLVENLAGWGAPQPDVYKGFAAQVDWTDNPVEAYRLLWEHINGSGSWAANPLVWVIEFSPA